ncbi:MAG: GMC family oxidoreductase N-terminal domain-containing protein [Chloroflexi bacterium]|nr:GMC family oxidoreductase N-terminal domain-containing protein [Chloroflexota bacterium]
MAQQFSSEDSGSRSIHAHVPFSAQPQISDIKPNYDYIILGAGSAGCIVAARLAAAFPYLSILLVEAGDSISPSNETVWNPREWALISKDRNLEWGYESTFQRNLSGRRIPMGRGKGMGGCSIHNAMVYVRGGAKGFNNWAAMGNQGWDYNSVVPYFQNVENQMYITVASSDPFIAAMTNACANLGIPYNPDYNQYVDQVCTSPFQYAISANQRRETTDSVFLAAQFPNLDIATETLIKKIVVENLTAKAVILHQADGEKEISANREIILTAGAIGSAHTLMLSGIGNQRELSQFGILPVTNLPGVGQNFQDDLYVTTLFKSKQQMPDQPYGLMGTVIFANSPTNNLGLGTDIECSLASGSMIGIGLTYPSYLIYPNIQLLRSRGTVTLSSADPTIAPIIDPNYLSAPGDMENCLQALQLARTIGANSALSAWFEEEVMPGPQWDNMLEEYIRQTAGTCYHYAGTCKMGIDDMAVVAPDLRVRGVSNLRVIDSSIIPQTVSGNTAAATMMIADKGSSLVIAGM